MEAGSRPVSQASGIGKVLRISQSCAYPCKRANLAGQISGSVSATTHCTLRAWTEAPQCRVLFQGPQQSGTSILLLPPSFSCIVFGLTRPNVGAQSLYFPTSFIMQKNGVPLVQSRSFVWEEGRVSLTLSRSIFTCQVLCSN